ncbi:MAG: 8-amino-7-oxononanoate synthase [Thermocrinis sp.]|jgi:8-amino-7-oxononanoate synthase|nr:8-amino-7-oxononanoate synthase [Thermocrinis sp.]
MDWIEEELRKIQQQKLLRKRTLREGLIDLCSNDYLGLREHPEVKEEAIKVIKDYGVGSGASALVSGYTTHHKSLEDKLADFKGVPACVLFGSGYLANLGTIPALVSEGDMILSDQLNHASIIDACKLSRAKVFVFPHLDYERAEEVLKENRRAYRRCLLVSDSVFSMDGDIAHLPTLLKLSQEYDCMLMLDEAHATGTLGEKGKGILYAFGIHWQESIILMGTLSKALGSYGAFVCGSQRLVDYLVNRARSLIFSTSLPPSLCASAKKALEILEREGWMVPTLKSLAEEIYKRLSEMGFFVKFHSTPILPIMLYSEEKALELSKYLLERGVFLQAIRYPTVPMGEARLRLTASLKYKKEDLEYFYTLLKSPSPPSPY